MNRFLVFLIAGWSGFFVMSVELLSGRVLAPNFGSSIYVWGGIITIFMLALSLGYLVGGRLSMNAPSLQKLSIILLLAAITTTPIVFIGDTALDRIFTLVEDPRYGSLISATVLFFIPTMISGMISPYAVRLLVTEYNHSGHFAGLLYFVSTFGSAAGTLLTSFYLVMYLEMNQIFWVMIGTSMTIGIFSLLWGKSVAGAVKSPTSLLLIFAVLMAPVYSSAETILHTERSLYRNITVYEENGERCMRFTRQVAARQTCFKISNPNHLVFNYTKMMLGSLYLQPDPGRILIIGLGGGSLPAALSQIVPKAEIDVIEIDPAVVKVARKFFNFQTGPRMKVFEEDGRVFVKRAIKKGRKYDLVMLDAFDHEYIPEHLLTREFLSEVKKVLTPDGVMAANTWSTSRLYDHESATYESVFDRFFSLKKKSRVILARNSGLPGMDTIKKNAKALEARLAPVGVGSEYLLPLFSTERDWNSGARILTDQYSPSNLLNVR